MDMSILLQLQATTCYVTGLSKYVGQSCWLAFYIISVTKCARGHSPLLLLTTAGSLTDHYCGETQLTAHRSRLFDIFHS